MHIPDFSGEIVSDKETLQKYSHDTSIFERVPKTVLFPRNTKDIQAAVSYVHTAKKIGEQISITARSAGTDMTGGPLNDSIILSCTKYLNTVVLEDGFATVEPGCFYRDFEKITLERGFFLPSFPASRNLCALGGMVNNDSAGELTLKYGKTHNYVESLDVVLSDGSLVTLSALTKKELEEKKKLKSLEGSLYREIDALLTKNERIITEKTPTVSKNSAGYALWRVRENNMFNLAQLVVGAQGTLALTARARLRLVRPQIHKTMIVVFLKELADLPEIVKRVLVHKPESFESYDEHTFSLAVHFLPQLLLQMGFLKSLRVGVSFLPELWAVLTKGVPKMVLMAEFAEDTFEEALRKAHEAQKSLQEISVTSRIATSEMQREKYWIIRRESFALLRKNLKGMYAAPFIDDFVVHPDDYPTFLPRLNALLSEYELTYTIAGHIGNGNFHIIPLMDISKESNRKIITELSPRVYDLVVQFGGSITGEHNDGIIRTPYLEKMFGKEMCALFQQVKDIFDPLNILNPGKKVGGQESDIAKYMLKKH